MTERRAAALAELMLKADDDHLRLGPWCMVCDKEVDAWGWVRGRPFRLAKVRCHASVAYVRSVRGRPPDEVFLRGR